MDILWDEIDLCSGCREKVREYLSRRVTNPEKVVEVIREKGVARFEQELVAQFPPRLLNALDGWTLCRILTTSKHHYLCRIKGLGVKSVDSLIEILDRNGLKVGLSKQEVEALGIPTD